MSLRKTASAGLFLLSCQWAGVGAFYLPGVAPQNFVEGQRVELKVSIARAHDSYILSIIPHSFSWGLDGTVS
jgi:hypothetical protein